MVGSAPARANGAARATGPRRARTVRWRTERMGAAPYREDLNGTHSNRGFIMTASTLLVSAIVALAALTVSGCAVVRGQETVGAYVDDATITTQIKSRMLANPAVAGTSISVETLNGTVMLSGFAKNTTERTTAEEIARGVTGVKAVRNEILVRP